MACHSDTGTIAILDLPLLSLYRMNKSRHWALWSTARLVSKVELIKTDNDLSKNVLGRTRNVCNSFLRTLRLPNGVFAERRHDNDHAPLWS